MNSKNLLTLQSVVAILFGLGLVFIPQQLLEPYLNNAGDLNIVGQTVGSIYGAALMAIGVGCWIARNDTFPKSWIYGILVAHVINLYIYLSAYFHGTFTSIVWTSIILSGIIELWAGYLLFIKKQE
jgi:hypothetical protein